ncbi:MAG: diadenosine tetraphosphatase [Rickettsiales bacterium]|nr:MAG: diadenosine tetraphosphatase [Rickettsiales bacterium]
MSRKIIGIMACTNKGVIGLNGAIPWRYPEEFLHFKNTTDGQIVVMGRRTFDELANLDLLSSRDNIVFTQNKSLLKSKMAENIRFISSLEEFEKLTLNPDKKIYMIGGAKIVELFLKNDMIDEFLLTKIHKEYDGDTYFPLDLMKNWDSECVDTREGYSIYSYKHKN